MIKIYNANFLLPKYVNVDMNTLRLVSDIISENCCDSDLSIIRKIKEDTIFELLLFAKLTQMGHPVVSGCEDLEFESTLPTEFILPNTLHL